MNRRTLKKFSKRALPLLQRYWPEAISGKTIFAAEKGRNYHGMMIRCSHERNLHGAGSHLVGGEYVTDICHRRCDCGWHPLKGTPMLGATEGYCEPEWEETTALGVLKDLVLWGGRAEGMTAATWEKCLRIARVTPITDDEIREMLA